VILLRLGNRHASDQSSDMQRFKEKVRFKMSVSKILEITSLNGKAIQSLIETNNLQQSQIDKLWEAINNLIASNASIMASNKALMETNQSLSEMLGIMRKKIEALEAAK